MTSDSQASSLSSPIRMRRLTAKRIGALEVLAGPFAAANCLLLRTHLLASDPAPFFNQLLSREQDAQHQSRRVHDDCPYVRRALLSFLERQPPVGRAGAGRAIDARAASERLRSAARCVRREPRTDRRPRPL